MTNMIKNLIILIYLGVVWGAGFTFIKYGLRTMGPVTEMAARSVIAFLGLLVISLLLKKDLRGHARYWFPYVVFAVLGIVLLWLADAFGEEYISAGLASVMVAVAPMVTFIITAFILREDKVSVSNVSGLIIGVVGLVLVVGIEEILAGGTVLLGVLIIAGGFMVFAINGVLAPRLVKNADPLVSATYFIGIGGVILLILAFMLEDPLSTKWTADNFLNELGLSLLSTASGFVFFYYLLNNMGALFASTVFYLMPVFGMLSGIVFLGDKIVHTQIVGIGVVLLGIYLIDREKFRKKRGYSA